MVGPKWCQNQKYGIIAYLYEMGRERYYKVEEELKNMKKPM